MITQLRIQNFKSLRDVTLDLQRISLLIGPNNCGKTNVLKALKFFSEFLDGVYPTRKRLLALPYQSVANNRPQPLLPLSLTVNTNSSTDYFGFLQTEPQVTNGEYLYYTMVAGVGKEYKGDIYDIKNLDKHYTEKSVSCSKITGVPETFGKGGPACIVS